MIERVRPAFQNYAWGTEEFIPELYGFEPSGNPYAEAWYGTHPNGPSLTEDGQPLTQVSGELPFLMKVMSIGGPLSIQVHPNKEQAEAGYAREEREGASLSEPSRNYKDPNHKPETIIALEDGLEARAGVRNNEHTERLVRSLGARGLIELWKSDEVRESSAAMYEQVIVMADELYLRILSGVLDSSDGRPFEADFPVDKRWLHAVAQQYPGDKGILLQLLMNYVVLARGEALHMTPRQPHAYLLGRGIEVMASSDNVLRAGLTPKHIDQTELLAIADMHAHTVSTQRPARAYDTICSDYSARRIARGTGYLHERKPSITLCTDGQAVVSDCDASSKVRLTRGQAVYSDKPLEISAPAGEVFSVSKGP